MSVMNLAMFQTCSILKKEFYLSLCLHTRSETKRLVQVGVYRFCFGITVLIPVTTWFNLLLSAKGSGSYSRFKELISVDFGGFQVVQDLEELVVHRVEWRLDLAAVSCWRNHGIKNDFKVANWSSKTENILV